MPKLEVTVSDEDAEFIRQAVESGRFDDAGELLRLALSLFREDERDDAAKLERLRRSAQVGFDALERGEYETIEPGGIDAYFDRIIAERRAREAAQR